MSLKQSQFYFNTQNIYRRLKNWPSAHTSVWGTVDYILETKLLTFLQNSTLV